MAIGAGGEDERRGAVECGRWRAVANMDISVITTDTSGPLRPYPRCDPSEALEVRIYWFFERWLEMQLAPFQGASGQVTSG